MQQLADALERFNRKERHLLVRAALGHGESRLELSSTFRTDVAHKLNIANGIPEDAWWAMDYHINWLAGALAVYMNDTAALNQIYPNAKDAAATSQLVEGNQEDIDLVIASGRDLVLIEAKAYGAWGNAQLNSKLARLEMLHAYLQAISSSVESDSSIRLHFLLISPTPPQKLTGAWPAWAAKGTTIPWIKLDIDQTAHVLTVTRCLANGGPDAEGDHWRIMNY